MTQQRTFDITSSAGAAYSDAFRTAQSLPSLVLVATLVIFVIQVAYFRFVHAFVEGLQSGGSTIPLFATLLLHAAAMALTISLLALAVLRFNLRGERPGRDSFPGPSARVLLFLRPAFVLVAVYTLPSLAATLQFCAPFGRYSFPESLVLPISIFGYAASAVLLVGFLPLFAAIAVDSPGASLANAVADTRRHVWRIFAVWFLVSIPIWGIIALTSEYLPVDLVGPGRYAMAIGNAVVIAAWSTVMACASAQVYTAIGNKLTGDGRPASLAPKQL